MLLVGDSVTDIGKAGIEAQVSLIPESKFLGATIRSRALPGQGCSLKLGEQVSGKAYGRHMFSSASHIGCLWHSLLVHAVLHPV